MNWRSLVIISIFLGTFYSRAATEETDKTKSAHTFDTMKVSGKVKEPEYTLPPANVIDGEPLVIAPPSFEDRVFEIADTQN